ncbi:AbrB/MazE/SpoVT family DNA-binding domain-containing protein [Nonomuraea sp. NPDC050328]|uniref:AbrB/MazE/SpoVT family DNA-binding domain-containing protein n=1 Tax=Nonomuraea sp. NPDC050328 TaxID=3364361 RepID=UPI003796B008
MDQGKRSRARRQGPARISSKHQITLPASLMRQLGLRAGDSVDIEIEDDHLVVRRHSSRFDGVVGTIPGFTEAVDVERSRDEW